VFYVYLDREISTRNPTKLKQYSLPKITAYIWFNYNISHNTLYTIRICISEVLK